MPRPSSARWALTSTTLAGETSKKPAAGGSRGGGWTLQLGLPSTCYGDFSMAVR